MTTMHLHNILVCVFITTCIFSLLPFSDGHTIRRHESAPGVGPISAVYSRKHDEIAGYECTAKMLFRVELPFVQDYMARAHPNSPHSNHTRFLIEETSVKLMNGFWAYIRGLSRRRPRRQLLVGAALAAGAYLGYKARSVFTKISNEFTGTESQAEERIAQLKSVLAQTQQDHLVFVNNVTSFSHDLTTTVNKLVVKADEFDMSDLYLLHLVQQHIAITRIEVGIERCVNKLIPFQILTPAEVRAKLLDLERDVKAKGYHLAISPEDIVQDETLKIADCFITDRNIYVLSNIPIRKVNYVITKLIPVPFAYHNRTCSLENNLPKVVAVSRDKIVEVGHSLHGGCDVHHDRLCMIPTFSHPSERNLACISSLLQEAAIDQLKIDCDFKCLNSSELIISELDNNVIIITFAKQIIITCPDTRLQHKIPDYGAVRMTIKCNCSYVINGESFDGTPICMDRFFEEDDVSVVWPYFIKDPNGVSVRDETWPSLVSGLSYSPSTVRVVEYPEYGGIHYRDYWLRVVSGVIIFIVTAIVLLHSKLKKLL